MKSLPHPHSPPKSLTSDHPASVGIPPSMGSLSPLETTHSILAVLIENLPYAEPESAP